MSCPNCTCPTCSNRRGLAHRVLAWLEANPCREDFGWTMNVIGEAMGSDPRHLANVLSNLTTLGKVQRPGRGLYRIARKA